MVPTKSGMTAAQACSTVVGNTGVREIIFICMVTYEKGNKTTHHNYGKDLYSMQILDYCNNPLPIVTTRPFSLPFKIICRVARMAE